MRKNIQIPNPDIERQCEIFSKCDVLLINRRGGIGDILCARLLFEDLKQIPQIGQITFAVPRKYLPLIKDHPFIDHKLAAEDLTTEAYEDYAFVKDITYTSDDLEYRIRPKIEQNRADIYADSIGLILKQHEGHLVFTDQEMEFAKNFIDYFGDKRKIGIAPFTSHISKDLPFQLVENLIFWCRHKQVIPLIFHDEGMIDIKDVIVVNQLTLREWMAVVSLLDVVVTASTAMFWVAQLTHRPTIVIAGHEDAQVFGQYHSNLAIVQRKAKSERKLYTTTVQKQERVKFQGDWSYCPCWDARKCAFKKWGEYPLFCLESIQIKEVIEPLDDMLNMIK
jgi:ADP-heptose:LPS heptosyltransferase